MAARENRRSRTHPPKKPPPRYNFFGESRKTPNYNQTDRWKPRGVCQRISDVIWGPRVPDCVAGQPIQTAKRALLGTQACASDYLNPPDISVNNGTNVALATAGPRQSCNPRRPPTKQAKANGKRVLTKGNISTPSRKPFQLTTNPLPHLRGRA